MSGNTTIIEKFPAFSIEDPMPISGGCTSDSMTKPSWTISNLSLSLDNSTDYSTALLDFHLRIDSAVYEDSFSKTFNVTDPPMWVDCVGLQSKVPGCKFQFDLVSNRFSVYNEWICDDKSNHSQYVLLSTSSTLGLES